LGGKHVKHLSLSSQDVQSPEGPDAQFKVEARHQKPRTSRESRQLCRGGYEEEWRRRGLWKREQCLRVPPINEKKNMSEEPFRTSGAGGWRKVCQKTRTGPVMLPRGQRPTNTNSRRMAVKMVPKHGEGCWWTFRGKKNLSCKRWTEGIVGVETSGGHIDLGGINKRKERVKEYLFLVPHKGEALGQQG